MIWTQFRIYNQVINWVLKTLSTKLIKLLVFAKSSFLSTKEESKFWSVCWKKLKKAYWNYWEVFMLRWASIKNKQRSLKVLWKWDLNSKCQGTKENFKANQNDSLFNSFVNTIIIYAHPFSILILSTIYHHC